MDRERQSTAGLLVSFAGLLLAMGTIMVFSASMTARPTELEQIYLSKHLFFVLVGVVMATVIACMPSWLWPRIAVILYLATIACLVMVLMPGFGRTVNGAQRWLQLGPLTFQPSETAKITLPLMLATVHNWFHGSRRSRYWELSLHATLIGVTLGLIVIEPDLGTAVFVGIGCMILLFLCGWPLIDFVAAAAVLIPLGISFFALKPYQLARVRGFIDAWVRPHEAPYQIQQSLTTLGVGGWTGTGLGQGAQKLSFLPEANTDFIFAVVGEELGLIGTIGIVLLWVGLYLSGQRLCSKLPNDSFQVTTAQTYLTMLVLQAATNIAVVTALVPPKGIPHPFLSYGGSSLVVSCVMVGMVLSLCRVPAPQPVIDSVDLPSKPVSEPLPELSTDAIPA